MYTSRLELVIDSRSGEQNLRRMERSLDRVERAGDDTADSMGGINSEMGRMRGIALAASGALAGLVGAMGAQEVIRYSDAWTNTSNLLRQVTDTTAELTQKQRELMEVANESRSSYESTVSLYTRLAKSTDQLSISDERLLNITESINKTFAISGAGAEEASNAIRQLAQGFAAGALRGDEFQSVSENAPEIMDAIANSLNKTRGELIDFAAEGGITAQVVIDAMEQAAESIDKTFGDSVESFGQKMERANNSILDFVGNTDDVGTTVSLLGDGIVLLSDNIDTLVEGVGALVVLATARLVPALAASAAGMAQKTLATIADTRAEVAATQAVTRRTAAELQTARALLSTAQLEARATAGTNAHGFALNQLSVARVRATNAAAAHALATNTATAAMGRASIAARGAAGALALFGGPAGVAIIAAGALYYFRDELGLTIPTLDASSEAVHQLTGEINEMSRAAAEAKLTELTTQLADLKASAESTGEAIMAVGRDDVGIGGGFLGVDVGSQAREIQQITEAAKPARQEMVNVEEAISLVKGRLEEINATGDKTAPTITNIADATKGLTKAQRDAQRESEKFESSLQSLLDDLFPLQANLRQYKDDQLLLNQAYIQGKIDLDQYGESLKRLNENRMLSDQRPDQAYDILGGPSEKGMGQQDQSGWESWLESAQTAFTDFDAMAASTAENFQRGFGEAFESMVFDSQNFGDAMYNLFDGIARTLVRSLGEMAAQWLAYQAVQALVGETAMQQSANAMASNAAATSMQAGLAAYASTAAIPIVGPVLAPGAMSAALSATAPIAAGIAALSYAGEFDKGGTIPSGQWGIAGERGPEIVQGPARVTSRKQTAEMMGSETPMQVDVQIINQGEPKKVSARMEQLESRRFILSVMQEDLNGDGPYTGMLAKTYGMQRKGR